MVGGPGRDWLGTSALSRIILSAGATAAVVIAVGSAGAGLVAWLGWSTPIELTGGAGDAVEVSVGVLGGSVLSLLLLSTMGLAVVVTAGSDV